MQAVLGPEGAGGAAGAGALGAAGAGALGVAGVTAGGATFGLISTLLLLYASFVASVPPSYSSNLSLAAAALLARHLALTLLFAPIDSSINVFSLVPPAEATHTAVSFVLATPGAKSCSDLIII